MTPDNCELVYWQLPEDAGAGGISKPFPAEMIKEGWAVATAVATKILQGKFEENPALRPDWTDPALLALCGQVGIPGEGLVVAESDAGD